MSRKLVFNFDPAESTSPTAFLVVNRIGVVQMQVYRAYRTGNGEIHYDYKGPGSMGTNDLDSLKRRISPMLRFNPTWRVVGELPHVTEELALSKDTGYYEMRPLTDMLPPTEAIFEDWRAPAYH